MCRGHLRYGSSSGKEEKMTIRGRVLGRSPSPQAYRFSALSFVHTPSPRSVPAGAPTASTLQGGQGGREQGGGRRALGNAARLWAPQDGQAGHLGGGLPPHPQGNLDNKAGLPPPASPAPALDLPQAPWPQRPTTPLPECFLRTYCAPGPRRRCARTQAAPQCSPPPPPRACAL